MQTAAFGAEIDWLVGLPEIDRTVVMCAEALPWRCHRSLIADAVLARSLAVEDILCEGGWAERAEVAHDDELRAGEGWAGLVSKGARAVWLSEVLFFPVAIVKQVRSRILLIMRVRVLYFGVLKESLGRESEMVELPEAARVADLMARFEGEGAEWMRSIAVAVNREYARREDVLRDGDEVALLPPVSGGRSR